MNITRLTLLQNIQLIGNEEQGADFLRAGGLLVYPTETFLAIGCLPAFEKSLAEIYNIKKRALTKPLPLLGSDIKNLEKIMDASKIPLQLAKNFWPGPLAMLLPAKNGLSPFLQNTSKKAAVRVTSHASAARLASLCDTPIICTSANLSGENPVKLISQLSAAFLRACEQSSINIGLATWVDLPVLKNILPSTIVEPVSHQKLLLHREGAISALRLKKYGFETIPASHLPGIR